MKGQTQALTTILITTVTIGAIASAYVWGTPLLEKRQDKAEIDQLERSVFELNDEVRSVSSGGSGKSSRVTLSISNGEIMINEDRDYIQITTDAQDSPYPEIWSLVRGKTRQNLSIGSGDYALYGSDEPVVLAAKDSGSSGSLTQIMYRIETRNMKRGDSNLNKIDLKSVGRTKSNGETTLILTNRGTETDSNVNIDGKTMQRTRTVVEVDLQ